MHTTDHTETDLDPDVVYKFDRLWRVALGGQSIPAEGAQALARVAELDDETVNSLVALFAVYGGGRHREHYDFADVNVVSAIIRSGFEEHGYWLSAAEREEVLGLVDSIVRGRSQ